METMEWEKWCRLCGKNNGSDVDATLKLKNSETLTENIRKYFGILISESDICTKICNVCNDTINSIVEYNSHVLKVNGMFLELEKSYLNENINLLSLRKKHGLNNNINGLKDIEMHETDFGLVKADVKSKSLSNSPPPVDVNSYLVIEYSDITFKSEPEDNSTTKQTQIDEAIKHPNENSPVVFPFGLNDLDEVNLRCRYCNMKFHKTDSLIKHTEKHFNYILTCNICKKHFPTKQSTQRHKATHLTNENEMQQQTNIKQGGDDNINLNQEAEIPSEKEKFFACNICQKRFTFRGRTKHMRKHFANKDIPQNPFPLQCRVCGKSCKNLNKLRSHEAVHLPENERKSYECSYCKEKYKTKQWLNYHVSFVHKKHRSFMCEFCGKAFPTNMNLRCHMLSHSKERKFDCSKCEKTFKERRTLKIHMDSHEGTEYPCQICGLKLNTRQTLRVHMLVHSDENKFKCNICLKQYKRLEQFKLHLMSHLKLKPFECFICNLTFASQATCRNHQKIKHPVELAAADLTDKPKTAKNVPSMKFLYEFNEKALCTSK